MRATITDWKNPDYRPVFAERLARLRALRANPEGWGAAWTYYSTRPVEAIEDWLFTFDPRLIPLDRSAYMPFTMFPRQREYIEWLHEMYRTQKEGITEKSRDMGVTWLTIAFAWWLWTFKSDVQICFGSRKKELVDTLHDPKSIFEKFRLMMRRLPSELHPIGWDEKDHAQYCRITNPENGSSITGEAGDNIGRGGRSTIYFIDETAFLESPMAAESALSENTPCKIWVSTPNRPGDWFHQKVKGGRLKIFRFHWTEDPRKDAAWYAERAAVLEPDVVAREIDLDYDAGVTNLVISAAWVSASQALHKWLVEHDMLPGWEKGDAIAGLDVADGGDDSALIPRCGPVLGKSEIWSWDDVIDSAHHAADVALERGCGLLNFDSVGLGRGTVAALRRQKIIRARGINGGSEPSAHRWSDGRGSKEKFRNLRAELWWIARERLKNTHRLWLMVAAADDPNDPKRLTLGDRRRAIEQALQECLLIPLNEGRVARELSLPTYERTETGKIQIESKKAMRSRGIKSPDAADACVMTFAKPLGVKRPTRTKGLY